MYKKILSLAVVMFFLLALPVLAIDLQEEGKGLGELTHINVIGRNLTATMESGGTGTITENAVFIGSYETVTCSSATPQGLGVLSLDTLISFVVTDTAGDSKDLVTLASATATVGQLKIVVLKTDGEASGLLITPAAFGRGTSVLLEDAGDGVMFVFDGATWQLCESDGQTIE